MKFLKIFEKGLSPFTRQKYLLQKKLNSYNNKMNKEVKELFFEFLLFLERGSYGSTVFKYVICYGLFCAGMYRLRALYPLGDYEVLLAPYIISLVLLTKAEQKPIKIDKSKNRDKFKLEHSELLEYY